MKGTSPSRGSGEVSANGNKCHDGSSVISSTPRKGRSINIITVGIDLAKNVFAVHGADDSGKPVLVKPKISRADLLPLIAQLPPYLIGMEAYSGAHHWARPDRRVRHRPAAESGLPAPRDRRTPQISIRKSPKYARLIAKAAKEDARSKRLMQRPGIGPVTASALLSSIGGGHDFKSGRQVAAWIGLVPGQYSSGGKARLGRITKAGDSYLRSLLVMGARAVLNSLGDKQVRSRARSSRMHHA